jgi:hypothetical protein
MVEFIGVGMKRRNWTAEMDSVSDGKLIEQIRQNKALRAIGSIGFDWNEAGTEARIYSGQRRNIGLIKLTGGSKLVCA